MFTRTTCPDLSGRELLTNPTSPQSVGKPPASWRGGQEGLINT